MSRSFELPEAEWATVGTVGEPGHRTFYLQARQDDQLVTLKLEKQQVAALAQFLAEILSDLPSPEDPAAEVDQDLVEPVLPEWAVGAIQLAYDGSADRIVILAEEFGPPGAEDEDDIESLAIELGEAAELEELDEPDLGPEAAGLAAGEEQAVGRIGITRSQAAGIARIGWELVGAGRPTCTLCGHPIDPEGHSCPRTNGHGPPAR